MNIVGLRNHPYIESYLKQQDETRHYIEEMAKSISVFQPIGISTWRELSLEKDHCIFCGATEYKKYPLVECQGKCGRKSHLVWT